MALKMKIESLGIYLPKKVLTTKDLMEGCNKKPIWDLEKLTGIHERRVAEGEYTLDLAVKAAHEALSHSSYQAEDLDMIFCTSISKMERKDDLMFEPAAAACIKKRLGAKNAIVFDITNACAGMFTGIYLMNSFISTGTIRCGLVVSGEYISCIADTARKEIRNSFDGQLASLTVGDCGAALILDRSADARYGFHEISLVTGAKHHALCKAQPSRKGSGVMMVTRPKALHQHSTKNILSYIKEVLDKTGWTMEDVQWNIPHQTSARAIKHGSKALREFYHYAKDLPSVINVEKYGNTSSTTHSLALHESMINGKIKKDDRLNFIVGASGIVLGCATYTMDSLAERYVPCQSPATLVASL